MGNENPLRQTEWQKIAVARWPGYAIAGDGQWCVVDHNTRAVMLLTFEANARNLYRAQPSNRQAYKLEIAEQPRNWQKDDWEPSV